MQNDIDVKMRRLLENYRPAPNPDIWNRIEKQMFLEAPQPKKHFKLGVWATLAAASAAILFLFWYNQDPLKPSQAVISPTQNQTFALDETANKVEFNTVPEQTTFAETVAVEMENRKTDKKENSGAGFVYNKKTRATLAKAVSVMDPIPAVPGNQHLIEGVNLFQQKKFCESMCQLEKARNFFCDRSSETIEINKLLVEINGSFSGDCICMANEGAQIQVYQLCH